MAGMRKSDPRLKAGKLFPEVLSGAVRASATAQPLVAECEVIGDRSRPH